METEPDKRFQDAREMRLALLRAVGRLPQCPLCGKDLRDGAKVCTRCPKRGSWRPNVATVMVMLLVGVVLGFLVSNLLRARARDQFTECVSNLKHLGTAMEMYSTDAGGRFPLDHAMGSGEMPTPLRLPQAIVPKYLERMPTCPAAGTDTYSQSATGAYSPDCYTLVCRGHHHEGAGQGPNYPQYTSTQGLITQ